MRDYERRANTIYKDDAQVIPLKNSASNVPNSALLAMYGDNGTMGSGLDTTMRARIDSTSRYRDKQIPSAEREAEQIAALIKGAKTPEDVKSVLGEQMGADFSDVRFHTDALAVQKADGFNARAYATGRDVYFGEGGFEPSVAAHELVHTAQQGAVQSSMPTVAAPMGSVQMVKKNTQAQDPEYDAAAEKKGFWGGLGRRMASPFRAMANILRPDKPLKALGRKLGIVKSVGMDDAAKRLAAEGVTDAPEDRGDAARYESNAAPSDDEAKKASALPSLIPTIAGVTLETGVNAAAKKISDSDMYGGLQDFADGKMISGVGTAFGIAGSSFSTASGVISAVQNAAKAETSRKGGNKTDATQAALQSVEGMGTAMSGMSKIMGYAGVSPGVVSGTILPGINVATGGVQAVKGTMSAISGIKTQRNMTEQIAKLSEDNAAPPKASMGFTDQQRRSLMRSMHMAREMSAINKEAGFGQMIAGGLTAAGGITTLSGVGTLPGTILTSAGTGLNVLSGLNKTVQVDDMRKRVVDQELGMDERLHKLDEELKQRGESSKYDKETKERIILQRMGYNSGSKTEVFMNIAMNRSKMMTDIANANTRGITRKTDPNANDDKKRLHGEAKYDWTGKEQELQQYRQRKFARETLRGMGLSKIKLDTGSSGYAQQGAAEKLGMDAGVDIHHQLASARMGDSAQEILAKKQAKAEGKITDYMKKVENASFDWTRKRYMKKLHEQEQKWLALSPEAHAKP